MTDANGGMSPEDRARRRARRRPSAPGGTRGPARGRPAAPRDPASRGAASGPAPGRSAPRAAPRDAPQEALSRESAPREPAARGAAAGGRAARSRDAARRAPARARQILRRRNPRHRLNATLLIIAVVLSLFAGRLIQMQGLDGARYRMLAQRQRTAVIKIPTIRGSISTSDGQYLALTVQTYRVVADPAQIAAARRSLVASDLAGPLGLAPPVILADINHPEGRQFAPLGTVSSTTATAIQALGLPGISLQLRYQRSYPSGTMAASLVGFTNEVNGDLAGEAGLEEEYNAVLAGHPGSEVVETGTDGVPIPLTQSKEKPPVPAKNLRLTIQSSIQYEAEHECRLRVEQTKARNCSIVVMTPDGRILAMAQYPTFNPSRPISSLPATRNIAVGNVFAPGSTMKPLSVAAALEKGGQYPLSTYLVPDKITVDGESYHDAEPHPTLHYTVAGILANSLNDGMVQIVQHITPMQQYDYLRAFGLGTVSGLGLPGESSGLLPRPGSPAYYSDDRYELSFGQGVGVTAIQMASVYATIANGGVRVQPTIVAGTTSSSGKYTPAATAPHRRVIRARTDRQLMTILQQVPKIDAAAGEPWGVIAGYPVASKTGTAQVSDGGTCLCQYGSSYIGIAPAQHPGLVVAVNIQDPRAGYYGDEIAGPVFYHVMKFALQTLKIPPTSARPPHIRLTIP